jgi:hypothetical protein
VNKATLLILALVLSHLVMAQIKHHGRYESEFDWKNEAPIVISNEQHGLLMVETFYTGPGKDYNVLLSQIDTAFNVAWQDTVQLAREFRLVGYHYTNQNTYLLLQNWPAQTKVKILEINTIQKKIISYEAKDLLEIQIQEFEMVQNTAVIGGSYEGRPVVLAFDLSNDKLRALSNVYQNNSKLIEVKVNTDGLTFNVLVSQENVSKDRTIVVNTYDYQGNPVRDYELLTKPEFDLITAVSSSINDITQVVVGLYGYKSEVNPAGVFVNHVNRVGEQDMRYYSFGELNHFFDYLGEKKADKYKKRALAAKKAGKEIRYRLHPVLAEMIEDKDHYVFFGEFIKGYNYIEDVNNRYGDINRYSTLNGPNSFDPMTLNRANSDFEFSHAFAIVLNKDGEILWDDWAEVDKEMNGTPVNMGEFQWLGDRGSYLYYSKEELRGKLFDDKGLNELLIDEIALNSDKDEVRSEDEESLRTLKWYDNYFLVFGVQNIKSRGEQVEQNRKFFINKVSISKNQKAKGLD